MKTLPIGKEDFKKLIEEGNYYVDKTEVIETLLKNNTEIALFPRPRRFGKSLFISMLDNFFDIDKKEENKNLFENLYISKTSYYDNLSKYPVIKLDFKGLKASNFDEFLKQFKILISRLYVNKRYVVKYLEESEKDIYYSITNMTADISLYKQSIKYLSEWLSRSHDEQKVVVLIDEYDAPVSDAYINETYDKVMEIIKQLFSESLKGNNYVKMGVLTGILRVSRESMFSDFNNPVIYDIMTKEYNEYFGFTKEETEEILKYYSLESNKMIKDYYDGYKFGGLSIYNPWSILNYVSREVFEPFWANTSSNALLKKCLKELNLKGKQDIEELLEGKSLSFTYDKKLTYKDFDSPNVNKVMNLLLMTGYLTVDREENDEIFGNRVYFKVPNREVKEDLINVVQSITFSEELNDYKSYQEFIIALHEGNKEYIERSLNDLLLGMSYFDAYEIFYQGYAEAFFGVLLRGNYIVKGNRETGNGRCDIIIEKVDRSLGMVIEIKVANTEAEIESKINEAKKQLKESNYRKELELDKVKTIYEYIIVFYEKIAIVR